MIPILTWPLDYRTEKNRKGKKLNLRMVWSYEKANGRIRGLGHNGVDDLIAF